MSGIDWTPGPWLAIDEGHGTHINTEKRNIVAWVGNNSWAPREMHVANALLIAAAPDLAQAARMVRESAYMIENGPDYGVSREAYDALMAALAKAEGE